MATWVQSVQHVKDRAKKKTLEPLKPVFHVRARAAPQSAASAAPCSENLLPMSDVFIRTPEPSVDLDVELGFFF